MDLVTLIIRDTMGKYRLVKFEKVKYVIWFDIVDFAFFFMYFNLN